MNSLVVLVLCLLVAVSQAIRLETLAETLAELRLEGVVDDNSRHHAFDVVMTVRLVRSHFVS